MSLEDGLASLVKGQVALEFLMQMIERTHTIQVSKASLLWPWKSR